MTQVVIKVIGNYSYQTSKCLGEGVYGKVYEGMERESKQKVAIKKIDLATFTNDKYLQNAIFSQIYLLKRFNHPNIVKFKDVLSSKNSLYIITQFCKNGDLKQLMKRRKFKEEEVFDVMRQILAGFSQLIRQKIVHRDLKPANILINEGVYKIGDFGFAKYVDNFGSQMLKSCVGSPIYMAPQILQRSQYTTKCDIWSVGIIFYEMLFGYPPWKARDQNQLLRGIKTIPISHILKRNSLSHKATQFLKRTLAYSEDDRIGWAQLFDMFSPKSPQKITQASQNSPQILTPVTNHASSRQRDRQRSGRLISNSNNSWSQQQLTPHGHGSLLSANNIQHRQFVSNSPASHIIKSQSIGSEKRIINNNNLQNNQVVQNVMLIRNIIVFYHFYLVQLFIQYGFIKQSINQNDIILRLYYVLALLIKYRNTYLISVLSVHSKNNKQLQDYFKKLKIQQQTYQMIFNEVQVKIQRQGQLKKIKGEITDIIGYGEIINQDKNDKIQGLIVRYAHQFAQAASEQVRKRAKNLRDSSLVQVLQNTVDILSLSIGRGKGLKQLKQQSRGQQQDLRDYVSKVINKLDKLSSSL